MTGIRKRITLGFSGIVCLLFFSGMLSLIELNHVSKGTKEILQANQRNIELAKDMLDAAHEQNMAFIRLSIFHETKYDSLCRASMSRLEHTLAVARAEALDKSFLDSLVFATTEMKVLTDNFLAEYSKQQAMELELEAMALIPRDSTDTLQVIAPPPTLANFLEQQRYDNVYNRLTEAIQSYMTSTQSSLAPRTEQMKKSAYRAVTPVLISLAVMIAIVMLLYFFMLLYCVNPIININRSLGDYLHFKIPYRPKGELQDELSEINEKIETLINISKQQNKS